MRLDQKRIEEKKVNKKYVRYKEAQNIYGIGLTLLKEMAMEAHAIIRRGRLVLIDCGAFEKYLDTFREF